MPGPEMTDGAAFLEKHHAPPPARETDELTPNRLQALETEIAYARRHARAIVPIAVSQLEALIASHRTRVASVAP